MLRRLAAVAAIAAVAALSGSARAAPPTTSSLPLTAGNQTYNECVFNDGTHFYVCQLPYAWDFTNNVPKALSIDPVTGGLGVSVLAVPPISFSAPQHVIVDSSSAQKGVDNVNPVSSTNPLPVVVPTLLQIEGVDGNNGAARNNPLPTSSVIPNPGTAIPPTKTQLTAGTMSTICPAPTVPLAGEQIQVSVSGGLGMYGETLTSASQGTGTGTADFVLTSGQIYGLLLPRATAITFFATGAGWATCIQDPQ